MSDQMFSAQTSGRVWPPHLPRNALDDLPRAPGVYCFYSLTDQLLYVGKSVDIKTRVLSHFSAHSDQAADRKLQQTLARIDFTVTPGDFSAQLLESRLIKQRFPLYNRRLKKTQTLFQWQWSNNAEGYATLTCTPVHCERPDWHAFGLFRSKRAAQSALETLVRDHALCQRLCGLDKARRGACFAHQLKKCLGACCGKEAPETYNDRLMNALQSYRHQVWPWVGPILIREVSDHDSLSEPPHLVDQWVYYGQVKDPTDFSDLERPQFDLDTYKILLRFLLTETRQQSSGLRIRPLSANMITTSGGPQ
ncbi:MAG: GIY-YIG nuclease family protein [Hydrogenovibrio sp.]|uniref:GIY-YIG nuclease family protein n=1 Tax=Hydrogenovibrio sp. TaxID=2065821 RepID=UPI00287071E3|nr:GIY-YIG nuclease family protein [Hydrogenovibrio sp.]MDR9500064.1 GIY-YIG nuclease family protein [Hydrogenovibrio sp.]